MNFRPITVLGKRIFRQRKSRNLVAGTAIALTTLLFTTLFVLSQSMQKNIIEMTFRQVGYDAQASFKDITEKQAAQIAAHPDVKEVGQSLVAGLGQGEKLLGRQVEVRFADESYAAHSFALPTTGRMPQAEDEIALDTIVLDRLGIPHKLGAHITLEWTPDFAETESRVSEFTLCGFWEGNESVYASLAWVDKGFAEKAAKEAAEGDIPAGEIENSAPPSRIAGMHMAQVTLQREDNIDRTMDRILADTGLTGLEYGVNLAYDPDMTRMAVQESLPMYLGMLLVFAAGYLIIYNIFQISVTADIQFYGKCKTLGVTKRQLKKLIYGQAARLCAIGIPMGMLSGYLLGAVLVPVLMHSDRASVAANPLIFAGSALFSAGTVLISCMRPARMAGKVSPIEALRCNDVQYRGKAARKRSGSASLAALAWFNLGRNKKRTITVICSLTLGLTLMSTFYAKNAAFDMEKYLADLTLADYQVDEVTSEDYIGGYDPHGGTLSDRLIAQVKELDGLEGTGCLYSHETRISLDEQTLANLRNFYTDDILQFWGSYDPTGPASLEDAMEEREASSVVYGLDGIALEAYAKDKHLLAGSIDRERFAAGGYVLAIAPAYDDPQKRPGTASVGEEVTIEGKTYQVMAVLDSFNVVTEGAAEGGVNDRFYLNFILPAETFRENWSDNTPRKLFFNVDDEGMDATRNMLDAYAEKTGVILPVTSRSSMAEQYARETRASAVMGNVISSVIALVGVLNFVNSMITSIVSRRKEFAMMQSVGMTKRQLCRLLLYEGLDYTGITLLASYVVSAFAVGIGVRAMVEGGFTTFRFTLLPLVLCTPVLILFALLIPYLCFRNVERDSLVERLRAE